MLLKSAEHHEIEYLENDRIFVIRLFGVPDEEDVLRCFSDYEGAVDEQCAEQPYSFVINVTEEAHSSIGVVRLIRQLLTNQRHRRFIRGMAAVNDDPDKVAARNEGPGAGLMPFFLWEEEAIAYLHHRRAEPARGFADG